MGTEGRFSSYFAYGANMNLRQMQKRCPNSRFVSTAYLDNYEFIINSRRVASIVPQPGKRVFGILWELEALDEARLDEFEGVGYKTYRKETLQIVTPEMGLFAKVYIASNSKRISSIQSDYFNSIVASAKSAGFPISYIEELQGWQNPSLGTPL